MEDLRQQQVAGAQGANRQTDEVGAVVRNAGAVDVAALASLYLAWARGRLKSHRRIERLMSKWVDFFGGRTVESVRRADIARWIALRQQQGRTAGTINADLVALSAMFTYAIGILEMDLRNPVARQFLRPPEGRVRYLTPTEAARLLEAAGKMRSPRLRPFIQLAINTGCRKSELTGLRWIEVDLPARRIILDPARTKSGRRRTVPLNQGALDALRDRRRWCDEHCPESAYVFCTKDGRPVRDVRTGMAVALGAAGIEDFHVHDLRHTFASWLVQSQVPLPYIRDLLGHSTVKMTERYAHLSFDPLIRSVGALDSLSPNRINTGANAPSTQEVSA